VGLPQYWRKGEKEYRSTLEAGGRRRSQALWYERTPEATRQKLKEVKRASRLEMQSAEVYCRKICSEVRCIERKKLV
jgi:hypothetical protein